MILYKEEKITREIHVPVQYPAYYRGYAYSSYYVAVLSDTLAIKVSVAPNDIFLRKGTPAEIFRGPGFEDFRPVGKGAFLEALRMVEGQVKGVMEALDDEMRFDRATQGSSIYLAETMKNT